MGLGGLFYFFFKKELEHREETTRQIINLQGEFHKAMGSISVERQKMDDLIEKTFSNYLKHIQALEKQLTKPIPADKPAPVVATKGFSMKMIPNEIDAKEKEEWEEVTEENLDKIVKSSPKIKIINSDDWHDLPTTVV